LYGSIEHAGMKIEHWDPADGPPTESAMRAKLTARGYRCDVHVYPPGTRFEDHSHGVDKIDGVLSGTFRIVMDGRSFVLRAGDMIGIPRGRVHSAEVVGDVTVVSIDAAR
jgi:mannose-6-phosphate isomerase-like protein (cupin superfamily)